MRSRSAFVLVCMVTGCSLACAEPPLRPEASLAEGAFTPIAGTELGPSVSFENEIDGGSCFPLLFLGTTVAWIFRAHALPGRVIVQPCIEDGPSTSGHGEVRTGHIDDHWYEAALTSGREPARLELRRLELPSWSYFSNPSFCGPFVAYWGLRPSSSPPAERLATASEELLVELHDLGTRRSLLSKRMIDVELATDNSGTIPAPRWTEDCSAVLFDAGVWGGEPLRFDVASGR
jgi:hypothetical protein